MKSSFIGFLKLMIWGAVLFAFPYNSAWGGVLIDRVVAVVNREIITQSDLDQAELSFRKTEPDERNGEADSDRAFYQRKLLNRLIEERLILHEAMRKGVRLSDSELELALRDIALRNQL
ncbi:MAG: SurA N-terminal domain-containing protein, partial [Nitrospiria bacterium]